jgi:hypothetical protein
MRISANASSNYLTDRLKSLGVGFSKGARCSFILIRTAWSKLNDLLAQGVFGFVRRVPGQVVAAPMVFGPSRYGWWFHCEVAGCRGKKISAMKGGARSKSSPWPLDLTVKKAFDTSDLEARIAV